MDEVIDPTSKNYGRLYAFLLDVSYRYIDRFRQTKDMGTTGTEIYNYFHANMSNLLGDDYGTVLNNYDFSYLSERQLASLNRDDGTIREEDLDLTLCFKIINLLKGNDIRLLTEFVVKERNKLCHASMKKIRSGLTQQQFQEEFLMMFCLLGNYGVKRDILNTCARNVELNVIG